MMVTDQAIQDGTGPLVDPDDVPVSALESVVLDLPDQYTDEIFASQLLGIITNYHTAEVERRSLRHQGENAKAEQVGKQVAVLRTQAALIQHEHPETVELYQQLASLKVVETRRNRATVI